MPKRKADSVATFDPMADVIEQMPEPSEFADSINVPGSETDTETLSGEGSPSLESTGEGTVDNSGGNGEFNFETPDSKPVESETFDPNIHCVDENGNPRLTAKGKFRRKRGKAGARPTPSLNDVDPLRMAAAKQAAQVSIAATFLAGQMAFGEDGAPLEGESAQMEAAYTNFYYLSEKPINIPPWALVAMVTVTYAARRMAMEKPRNRVMVGVDWIVEKTKNLYRWATGG